MSVRSSRRLNKKLSTPEVENKNAPLNSTKKTRSARKIRKTNDLLYFSFNDSVVEKEKKNTKSPTQNLPILDKSGKSEEKLFSFKEVENSKIKSPPSPAPKEKNYKVKQRKFVKAKRILRGTKHYEVDNCNEETLNVITKNSNFKEKSIREELSENCKNSVSDSEGSSMSIKVKKTSTQNGRITEKISPTISFNASTAEKEDKSTRTPKVKDSLSVFESFSFREIENCKIKSPSSPVPEEKNDNKLKKRKVVKAKKVLRSTKHYEVEDKCNEDTFNAIMKSFNFNKEESIRQEMSENCKNPVSDGEGSPIHIKVKKKKAQVGRITEKISPSVRFDASTTEKEDKSTKTPKVNKQKLSLDKSSNQESFSRREIKNYKTKASPSPVPFDLPGPNARNDNIEKNIVKKMRILRNTKHCEIDESSDGENDETFNVISNNSDWKENSVGELSENCKTVFSENEGSSNCIEVRDSTIQNKNWITKKINETTISGQLSEKKDSFGSNLLFSELPSPISASTQSLKDEASPYLSVYSEKICSTISFDASTTEKEDKRVKRKVKKQNLSVFQLDESGNSGNERSFSIRKIKNSKIKSPPSPVPLPSPVPNEKNDEVEMNITKKIKNLQSAKHCEIDDKNSTEENDETFNVISNNSDWKENSVGELLENCKTVFSEDEENSNCIEVRDSTIQNKNWITKKINETTISEQLSEKKDSFGSNLLFSELPSPISASTQSLKDEASPYLSVYSEKICSTISFDASATEKEDKRVKRKVKKQNLSVFQLDESGSSGNERSFSIRKIKNSQIKSPPSPVPLPSPVPNEKNDEVEMNITRKIKNLQSAKHCEIDGENGTEENDETFNAISNTSDWKENSVGELSENCNTVLSLISVHDEGSSSCIEVRDSTIQNENWIPNKVNETTISDQLSEKKDSLGSNLVISELPSPISPSTQSLKEETSPYLSVHSAKEPIQPSLNGSSDETSIRRRTYELENSVNDVSLLKSLSEKDLSKSSSSDDKSEESVTPKLFSKVTRRKKWNKVHNTPFQIKGSPSWINAPQPSTSNSRHSTPDVKFRNLPKLMSSAPRHSAKKPLSNIKMPNFAAIHKRAMEKTENIVEYKQRKEERAKMLLSGKKPQNEVATSEKNGKKRLRFAPGTAERTQSMTFIPLPSTPLPKSVKNNFNDSLVDEDDKCEVKTRTPVFKFNKPTYTFENKVQSPVFKFTKPTFTIEQRDILVKKANKMFASHIPLMKKTNFGSLTSETSVEKRVLMEKNGNVNTFGASNPLNFNLKGTKARTRHEEIKSIINKKQPSKNTLEARKCTIKGVRSNRRFELLMNMRKGK